jgi:hypothetical protein
LIFKENFPDLDFLKVAVDFFWVGDWKVAWDEEIWLVMLISARRGAVRLRKSRVRIVAFVVGFIAVFGLYFDRFFSL